MPRPRLASRQALYLAIESPPRYDPERAHLALVGLRDDRPLRIELLVCELDAQPYRQHPRCAACDSVAGPQHAVQALGADGRCFFCSRPPRSHT
jgi:hypothetical protein